MIVELKLDRTQDGFLGKPYWVKTMAGLEDLDNHTVIGFVDSDTIHKIPETVRIITTTQELKDRCQDIHTRYPYLNYDESTMTTGEVDTMVDDLVAARDIGGPGVARQIETAVSMTTAGQRIILVTDTAAARTITIKTTDFKLYHEILIIDTSGLAGTNNITIDTEGTEKINGVDTEVISTNYGFRRLYCDGTNMFIGGRN